MIFGKFAKFCKIIEIFFHGHVPCKTNFFLWHKNFYDLMTLELNTVISVLVIINKKKWSKVVHSIDCEQNSASVSQFQAINLKYQNNKLLSN